MSGGLRLEGAALAALRHVVASPIAAKPVWAVVREQMGAAELRALAFTFPAPEASPRPLAGAPRRAWTDRDLGAPASGRVTARALRDAYTRGALTPIDVIERLAAHLAAADFGEAHHSPFAALDLEVARIAADRSRTRWQRRAPVGALDGIPIAVKDEQALAGLPCTVGTRYRTTPAQRDAHVTAELRRGGALLFASTQMSEWGLSPVGVNPNKPMPRNVYARGHAAGGSSTGSGVAVALGYGPIASGTDAGGSIRTPAALNGVFGLKPTLGRVGRTGSHLSYASLTHIGPIGQSTEDLVDYLEATIRADAADPTSTWPADRDTIIAECRRALGRGVRGCRIGIPLDAWIDAAPDVAAVCRAALRELEREGAQLVRMEQPLARRAMPIATLILGAESIASALGADLDAGRPAGDDVAVSTLLMKAADPEDLLAARRARAALRRDLAYRLSKVDVLAFPTTATTAPAHPLADDGKAILDEAGARAMTRYAFLANLTGVPAGTVPAGTAAGLPVGLQIVGDAWDEPSVLAVLAHVERLGLANLPRPSGYRSLLG